MATGKVKWFNNAKGYGFVPAATGGEDLFAHYSSIVMDGYKTLRAGQDVTFDVQEGSKGLHAVNIRVVSEEGVVSEENAMPEEGAMPEESQEGSTTHGDESISTR